MKQVEMATRRKWRGRNQFSIEKSFKPTEEVSCRVISFPLYPRFRFVSRVCLFPFPRLITDATELSTNSSATIDFRFGRSP